ncbi:hypothetical protein H4Q26_013343 [Puccinia striiformis f. sp. tritici PST-130]|nr:hypothetical protein H4Q26_013343 [Puccinia striiformis f. sp. tritici PST-130]
MEESLCQAEESETVSPGFPTTFEIPPLFTLSTTRPVTPLENIKLIEDTFTLVKQQRLNRPPKLTPNQDYLLVSSEERLNRIVAQFRLKQENKLEHQIFLNRSPRVPSPQEAYQDGRSQRTLQDRRESNSRSPSQIRSNPNHINFLNFRPDAYQRKAKWLLSELKKNRTNGAKEESQYLAFVQLYGDYKEELAKARTTTPKKIEKVPVKNSKPLPLFKELEHGTKSNYPIAHSSAKKAKPTVPPNLEPTGNVLLDAHIAKKAANELKAIVPLDISDTSTIESTDSLFTTKPFELTDLFPKSLKEKISAALSSTPKAVATPISTKATPISKLLVVDDSDNEGMDNHPHSTPDLTTLNQEERERVEKKISPLPSLSFKKKNQEAVVLPSAETTPEPLLEEEEEVPNKELIRTLVNKHVKIYRTYLTTSLKEDQKTLLDRAQESQKVLHKLIGNPAVEAYTKGWNPWDEKKKLFPAPPKIKNKGKKRPRIQPSTDQLFSLPPQLQTPQGTQHRSQGSREVETTRSSDDILKHMLHHM